jgi:hypothetical protein
VGAITTKNEFLEFLTDFPSRLETFKQNRFQKKKRFKVKVLSSPRYFSENPDSPGNYIESSGRGNVAIFMGRILDNKMAHQMLLKEPQDSSIANNDMQQNILRSLHIKVVAQLDGQSFDVKEGDVIDGILGPGTRLNQYDLQFMNMSDIQIKNEQPVSTTTGNATSLNIRFRDALFGTVEDLEPAPEATTEANATGSEVLPEETDITVIYWYAGLPANLYGKAYVENQIKQFVSVPDDTLFVVGEYTDSAESMIERANKIIEENNYNKTSERLGAWSGGARAFARHLQAQNIEQFDKIEIADPEPNFIKDFAYSSKVNMYYNLNEWTGEISSGAIPRAYWDILINNITTGGGSTVSREDLTHSQILVEQLKRIVL